MDVCRGASDEDGELQIRVVRLDRSSVLILAMPPLGDSCIRVTMDRQEASVRQGSLNENA